MAAFKSFNKEEIGAPPIAGERADNFNPDEYDLGKQKSWRYYHDTIHRKHLICWVMWIIPVWLLAVLAITAFAGAVSDTVKTTLLVTTTANVIGLALVVLKGMFSKE
ncbi:hypothetical protein [Alistipes onderdonkii]|uniref:hypothetical protein n=1 Tax=Alistipes onderdonkii TaxID=328813 RepID=UPI0011774897|nr:hypothetical protein [Alistipes onderdonkii]